jgi:hypothetical protein
MKLKLLLLSFLIAAFTVKAQKIFTIAGMHANMGYTGDGGLADTAKIESPSDVVVDALGNTYIADNGIGVVRMINTAGIISTYAGTGGYGYTGDGGAATAATFKNVRGLALDAIGNLYISDGGNGAIRMVTQSTGVITTFAGGGSGGDGAAAYGAYINMPWGICFDNTGNLYIAEYGANHIRMVNTMGIINTVAGSATFGSMGDGGLATNAEIYNPTDVACDAAGNFYIADQGNNRVRVVSGGIINNFAGDPNNASGFSGDGAAATAARLNAPMGISFDAAGNLYIADQNNNRIRKVTQSTGFISTICGTSMGGGYNGDAINASTAQLNFPVQVTAVSAGTSGALNLYVCDQGNNSVREITSTCIAPTVCKQPVLGPVCIGSNAYITTGNSLINTISWQWQVNKGTGWTNLVGSGYTNSFDTINNITTSKNGWRYRCKLIGCSNAYTDSVTIVITHPNVMATNAQVCPGTTTATLTVSGANTYTWSTGVNDTLNYIVETPTVTTTYTVTGTDTTTKCTYSALSTITVIQSQIPNICLVTTDTSFTNNIVYWDKTLYTAVDSFIVYRYDVTSSSYLRLGAVSKDSSQFTDLQRNIGGPNGGDPNITAWQYKIAILDSCGSIGTKSPYHQTVNIQQNNQNITWNAYLVEAGQANPVSGYQVLRDSLGIGDWHVFVNTSGLSTNDPSYTLYPNANYRVDALGFNCNPTQRLASGNNNVDVARVKSHSNQNNNRTASGIKNINANKASIYPNPANNMLNISFANAVNKANVKLYSIIGNEVLNTTISGTNATIDISELNSGAYMLQITTNTGVETKKIVKQ